jgi:hypothetical protein
VNVLLYIGLGMMAVGLVITFVGLGEKGFKTTELQMIGPGLVGGGVILAILRILLCLVPVRHSQVRGGGEKMGKNGLVLTLRDIETSEGVAVITESAGTN